MQDSFPCHAAYWVNHFHKADKNEIVKWWVQSPDMNPTENFWNFCWGQSYGQENHCSYWTEGKNGKKETRSSQISVPDVLMSLREVGLPTSFFFSLTIHFICKCLFCFSSYCSLILLTVQGEKHVFPSQLPGGCWQLQHWRGTYTTCRLWCIFSGLLPLGQ